MATLDFPSSPIDGQVYTANGRSWIYNSSSTSWDGIAGPIGGSNAQVIFNDNGVANGSSSFTFNKTTGAVVHAGPVSGITTLAAGNSTITGNITLTGGIIANGSIGTTGQALVSNGSVVYWTNPPAVTTDVTAPTSPNDGDLWWDEDAGQLRIYYNDGTSTQWVDASPSTAGPQGPQGSVGSQGTVGAQGVQGSVGSQGTVGAQGVQGAQGAVGVQGAVGSFSNTLIADLNANNYKIIDSNLQRYTEIITSVTPVSNTVTLNLSLGNVFTATLAANSTLAFSNTPSASVAMSITLITTQGTGGNFTLSYPASVLFTDGVLPILATDAGKRDVLTFLTVDGGTTYLGGQALANT